jgi:HEPN domain-containing protein
MPAEGAVASLLDRKRLRALLGAQGGPSPEAVVLIGSWARGAAVGPMSDVDLLVLADNGTPNIRASSGIQLLCLSMDELRRRLVEGDDLAQWALRYGLPLRGRTSWSRLREELLPSAPWPDSRRKWLMAKDRLRAASDLLAMGDHDAAQQEARFAASHAARAELLAKRAFPLSRPELPGQLRAIGDEALAAILDRLALAEDIPQKDLQSMVDALQERASIGTDPQRQGS